MRKNLIRNTISILALIFLFKHTITCLIFHLFLEGLISQTDGIYSLLKLFKRYEFMLGISAVPFFIIGVIVDGLEYRPKFIRVSLFIIGLLWLPIYWIGTLWGLCIIFYAVFKKTKNIKTVETSSV